jgi:hypothetical protein
VNRRFTTPDGREVMVHGPVAWSNDYYAVSIDGVPHVRPASVLVTHLNERNEMARTKETKDVVGEEAQVAVAASSAALDLKDPETSVDDVVEDTTPKENADAVKRASGRKPSEEEKDEQKEKQPTTAEVAAAWIVATLEKEGPMTKKQLNELALKGNKERLNTEAIVAAKKVGRICPANRAGAYIPEGLDAGRNGGIQFVFADEKERTLRVK